jgi:hypothetical protein
VPIKITVDDVNGLYVDNLKQEFRNAQSFKWQNFARPRSSVLTSKSHLDQGLIWADRAVHDPANGVEKRTDGVRARRAPDRERPEGRGEKTIERAIALPAPRRSISHQIARFQQMPGQQRAGEEVFFANAKRFPNQWPVNVGLARAYAMSGDNQKAISYAKKAIAQAPDEGNKKNLENLNHPVEHESRSRRPTERRTSLVPTSGVQ